ncbi:MAG: hypothetical protein AAFS10_20805, partial [Myxococcota bacterium]
MRFYICSPYILFILGGVLSVVCTSPARAQSQGRSQPHLPCPAIGQAPETYQARAIDPSERLDLRGAWRMVVSDHHAMPNFAQTDTEVALPGWVAMPPRSGDPEDETTVWLERRFD